MSKDQLYNRIRGALYGVAVGDALGAPLEFMSRAEIQKQYGKVTEMIGGGWLGLKPGETTDDTAMTVAVAEGIVENPDNPIPAIGERFKKWYLKNPRTAGRACSEVIQEAIREHAVEENEWFAASQITNERLRGMTEGNGALMRTVYVGLYYADREIRETMADKISAMTHWSNVSSGHCIAYVNAINVALTESGKIKTVIKGNQRARNITTYPAPTGHVRNTYDCALFAIKATDTLEEALIAAVNSGGDTDTIGAVTGGLAGAIYGYDQIPERWIKALDPELRKKLDKLAKEALKARTTLKEYKVVIYQRYEKHVTMKAHSGKDAYDKAMAEYEIDSKEVMDKDDLEDCWIEILSEGE